MKPVETIPVPTPVITSRIASILSGKQSEILKVVKPSPPTDPTKLPEMDLRRSGVAKPNEVQNWKEIHTWLLLNIPKYKEISIAVESLHDLELPREEKLKCTIIGLCEHILDIDATPIK